MKTDELRDLETRDLESRISVLRQDIFQTRFRHATSQLTDTSKIRAGRRSLACALTVLRERNVAATGTPASVDDGQEG